MSDLSNAEISVEGEYGECLVCGESFHWEQLTNLASGSYCDADVPDEMDMAEAFAWAQTQAEWAGDMGHDTALEHDTFGDAL